jgi:hypothetical protein
MSQENKHEYGAALERVQQGDSHGKLLELTAGEEEEE